MGLILVTLIGLAGRFQSKSGRESDSESEFRTTCSPFETTRLLAIDDGSEDCDVVKERFSEVVLREALLG